MALLDVYRMEHVQCPTDPADFKPRALLFHGPHFCPTAFTSCANGLGFGTRGFCPDDIEEHEVCGVLASQARYWWSNWGTEVLDNLVENGWGFGHYRVRETAARECRGQILFDPAQAVRLGSIGFPRFLLSDRRSSFRSVGKWHKRMDRTRAA